MCVPFQHCGYLEATRSCHKRETRWTREQKVRNDTTRNSFHNIVFFTCILRGRALLNCFNFPFLFNCLSFYVLYLLHAVPLSYIFLLVLLMDIYGNNIIKSKQRFFKTMDTGLLASMLHRIGFISRPSFKHDILLRHVIVKGY